MSSTITPNSLAIQTTTNALYRLATMPAYEGPARQALEGILRTVQSDPKINVPGLNNLLRGTAGDTAEILCAIAQNRDAVRLLASSGSDLEALQRGIESHRIDTSLVAREIEKWRDRIAGLPPPRPPADPLARLCFDMDTLCDPSFGISVAGLVHSVLPRRHELARQLTLSAMKLGGLVYGLRTHPSPSTQALLAQAERGFVHPDDLRNYYASFRPFASQPPASPTSPQDVIQMIANSAGTGGVPHLSQVAALRGVLDLLRLGTIATESLQRDPSGRLYDHVVPAVALGILGGLGWQPTILHAERLNEIRELQESGAGVIVVSNHRSYLDILALVALLTGTNPRLVAKYELEIMPAIGHSAVHHPDQPDRWVADGCIGGAHHVMINRGNPEEARRAMQINAFNALRDGFALCGFPSGTRDNTFRMPRPPFRKEFGIGPYRDGFFHTALAAAEEGRAVYVVPVAIQGAGIIMPKRPGDIARGAMVNQPVVMSVGVPIRVERASDGNPRGAVKDLKKQTWRDTWDPLFRIQAFMQD